MQSWGREQLGNDIRLALHIRVLGKETSSVLFLSPGKVKTPMSRASGLWAARQGSGYIPPGELSPYHPGKSRVKPVLRVP